MQLAPSPKARPRPTLPPVRAVTYRVHRDLVERIKATAEQQDVTVTAFVTRALETEIGRGVDRAGDCAAP